MKITCPNCNTTYELGATSIAPEGRDVRCSRCSTTWHIDPPSTPADESPGAQTESGVELEDLIRDDDGPTTTAAKADDDGDAPDSDDNIDWAEAMAPEPAAPKTSDPDWAFDGADADDRPLSSEQDWQAEFGLAEAAAPVQNKAPAEAAKESPPDPEEAASETAEDVAERKRLRQVRNKQRREVVRYRLPPRVRASMGLALFATSILLTIGMVTLRVPIVQTVPNMANLYALVGLEVNLRGLEFRDLRTFREYDKGAPVLIVEGMVENIRDTSASVPAIRLALRSVDQQEIYAWTVEPRQLQLRAGQTMRFSTRLAAPPEVAADVLLRFTDRSKTDL